jgi:hypothetical protein
VRSSARANGITPTATDLDADSIDTRIDGRSLADDCAQSNNDADRTLDRADCHGHCGRGGDFVTGCR